MCLTIFKSPRRGKHSDAHFIPRTSRTRTIPNLMERNLYRQRHESGCFFKTYFLTWFCSCTISEYHPPPPSYYLFDCFNCIQLVLRLKISEHNYTFIQAYKGKFARGNRTRIWLRYVNSNFLSRLLGLEGLRSVLSTDVEDAFLTTAGLE